MDKNINKRKTSMHLPKDEILFSPINNLKNL